MHWDGAGVVGGAGGAVRDGAGGGGGGVGRASTREGLVERAP